MTNEQKADAIAKACQDYHEWREKNLESSFKNNHGNSKRKVHWLEKKAGLKRDSLIRILGLDSYRGVRTNRRDVDGRFAGMGDSKQAKDHDKHGK